MQKLSENTDSVKPLLRRGLGRLPSWLKSKYLIAAVCFAVWMLFFDPKDVLSDIDRRDKLNELQTSELHLKQQITDAKQELDLLKNNAQSIEKYAREKYLMKKDNEDLFIVKPAPENK
jgi:cell division protein FtsB